MCIVVIIFAEAKTYVSNNYQIIWILSYSPQKIFRFFHKKFQLKTWESLRIFQLHFGFIFLQISFFTLPYIYSDWYGMWSWFFYFHLTFTGKSMFKVLKKKSVTVSCLSISEKGDHTTQKSNYISGKWKELKFRKWSIKWCWNILTKSNLLRRNFLSNCTKKFSRGSMEDKSK